jgi:sodium/potassium-transporting ATPase subunit alpha
MIVFACGFLNSLHSKTFQNYKHKSLMAYSKITVVRQSKDIQISAVELVKGDVVKIKSGDIIPADIRIFKTDNLHVDNALLTGDKAVIKITSEPGVKEFNNPLNSTNMLFYSTKCTEGEGIGIVINTANNTLIGKISELSHSAENDVSQFNLEYKSFIRMLAVISVIIAIVFFIIGYQINNKPMPNFLNVMGLLIANTPIGISCSLLAFFLVFRSKFKKRNLLVKDLHTIEALGSTTCIVTEKTGILTENKMSLVYLWYDMEYKTISKSKEDIQITIDKQNFNVSKFHPLDKSYEKIKYSAVCSSFGEVYDDIHIPDSFTKFKERKKKFILDNKDIMTKDEMLLGIQKIENELLPEYKVYYRENFKNKKEADSIDSGILRFFNDIEILDDIRQVYQNFNEKLNFYNPNARISLNIIKIRENNISRLTIVIKGTIDKIIDKCSRFIIKGKEFPISKKFKEQIFLANKYFMLNGKKVFALAYLDLNMNEYGEDYDFKIWSEKVNNNEEIKTNFPMRNFVFTSLIALEDAPK